MIVTHSLTQAAYLADQVIVLRARAGGIATNHRLTVQRPRKRAYLDDPAFHAVVQDLRASLRGAINASVQ